MSLQVEGGTQVQVPRSLMQAFLQQDPNHPGLETVRLSGNAADDPLPSHCREIESELCLVCRRCGRAYPQESTLLAHQRSCYLGNQQRRGALRLVQPRYACSLCDSGTSTRTYGTITELRRHLETVQHRTRLEANHHHHHNHQQQIGKQSLQQQKPLQLDNILNNVANMQSGEEANPLIDEMEDVVNQITLLAARAAAESTTGQQTNGNQDNNNGPDSKRQKHVQEVAAVAGAR